VLFFDFSRVERNGLVCCTDSRSAIIDEAKMCFE